MTFFFPQHSSLSLFLQLCRFTSLSLPPICACPAHASLPFLHFYQSLSCLDVLSPAHTHTLFIISHAEPSLLVCPHLSLPSISAGSTLNTIPLYIRTRSKPIRPFLSYTSPTFLSLPPVLIGLLLSSKWAFLFGRFSVLNEYLNWSFYSYYPPNGLLCTAPSWNV